jgi:branched-chain amino acid transport system substrate-binding protein
MAGGNEQTEAIVDGEQLRLNQSNYLACNGTYKILYEAWDDASPVTNRWDPAKEIENANNAAADSSVIAYLGTFNSGAALLSIPILNEAGPLVMISPANTNPYLTKRGRNPLSDLETLYPSGVRNYARVTTADDVQGTVAARFMKSELNVQTVYILDDGDPYGAILADAFEESAQEIGLTVLGRRSIEPGAQSYSALMDMIAKSNSGQPPDAIYASMVYDNNAPQLLKDKVAAMGENSQVKFMGPDGIHTQDFIDLAGADIAEGVYTSFLGPEPEYFPEKGQQFLQDYKAEYKHEADYYAIYGYEVMNVLLQAIENVCQTGGNPANREEIRAAVFAIRDFSGALGTWSFDENGDTTMTDMTFYEIQDGDFVSLGLFK